MAGDRFIISSLRGFTVATAGRFKGGRFCPRPIGLLLCITLENGTTIGGTLIILFVHRSASVKGEASSESTLRYLASTNASILG